MGNYIDRRGRNNSIKVLTSNCSFAIILDFNYAERGTTAQRVVSSGFPGHVVIVISI
jgi:hypothetical protein